MKHFLAGKWPCFSERTLKTVYFSTCFEVATKFICYCEEDQLNSLRPKLKKESKIRPQIDSHKNTPHREYRWRLVTSVCWDSCSDGLGSQQVAWFILWVKTRDLISIRVWFTHGHSFTWLSKEEQAKEQNEESCRAWDSLFTVAVDSNLL